MAEILTRRQHAIIVMLLLAHVAAVLNRSALPPWMRVEYYQEPPTFRMVPGVVQFLHPALPKALGQLQATLPPIAGHPSLIVGDSMILGWPWEADIICVPGGSSVDLLRRIRADVGDRTYEQAVLWYGSSRLCQGASVREYRREINRLLKNLRRRAGEVVIISPMPAEGNGTEWWHKAVPVNNTVAIAAEATAALSHAPVVALNGWRAQFTDQWDDLTYDHLHLNAKGFAELEAELVRVGFRGTHWRSAPPPTTARPQA